MQPTIQPSKYIPQLDGLRGIAILLVIGYHYLPGSIISQYGWSGVDLFFVLSGFLITGRLFPFLHDKKLLQKFYRNRFLRIAPLYFGFLLVFFGAWFMLTSRETQNGYPFYGDHWWGFLIFIQNWMFIHDFPPAAVHLNHLWSLATEEQFYLLFPLFILLVRVRSKLLIAAISLVVLIIICRSIYFYYQVTNNEYELIYWNAFFRMDSFLAGCILYLLLDKKTDLTASQKNHACMAWVVLMPLIALLIVYKTPGKNAAFFSTIGYTIVAITYACSLYLTLLRKNKLLDAIMSNQFLIYTGKISYGLYIFHWPVYLFGIPLLHRIFDTVHFTPSPFYFHLGNVIFCILVTYLISHLSFRYYESGFLKWKAKFN